MPGQIVSSGATHVVSSGVTESGDVVTDPGSLAGLSSGNVLVVSAAGSGYDLQLDPSQDYSRVSFRLASDGHGGTELIAANGLSINLTYEASVGSAPAGFLTALGQGVGTLE